MTKLYYPYRQYFNLASELIIAKMCKTCKPKQNQSLKLNINDLRFTVMY